jgi:signal transduction histidine kinase
MVLADGHYLERAIQNLITNALRYAQTKVRVTVTIVKDIEITVEDDGDGVPAADRQRIWQPFSRLESSRNKAGGGFGLGLAIVAKILEWHQGIAYVTESSLGGASFHLRWPLQLTSKHSGKQ